MKAGMGTGIVLRGVLRFAALCSTTLLLPGQGWAQAAKDYRADFPTQYSESQMGVNLQTGRFRYQPYSFEMGPFQQQRGFGQASFPFAGRLYWTSNGSSGALEAKVLLNGMTLVFTLTSSAPAISVAPWTSQSMGWNLERVSGGYNLTDRSGNLYFLQDSASTNLTGPIPTGESSVTLPTSSGPAPDAGLVSIVYTDGHRVDISRTAQKAFFRSTRGYAMLAENTGTTSKLCGFNLTLSYADINSSCVSSTYVVTTTNFVDAYGNYNPTSLIDVAGHTSTFQYQANGKLKCVTLPDSSTCEFTNSNGIQPGEDPAITWTKGDQVRVQTDALGRTFAYNYEPPDQNQVDNPPVAGLPIWSSAYMTDPAGRLTWLRFDRGVLVNQSTPDDELVFSYPSKLINFNYGTSPVVIDYHGQSPAYVRHREGNLDYYGYNRRGSVVIASKFPKGAPDPTSSINGSYIFSSNPDLHDCCVSGDVPNIPAGSSTIYRSFKPDYPANSLFVSGCGNGPADAKLCDKPLLIIDPKGNQTEYTYDPAHGGVLTKTLPPDANGVRAQVRYEYAQRYAWVSNGAGAYVTAGDPIWLKARERTCKATATVGNACAGGASDEVVTDYEYGPNSGPNNLLLRGVAVTADGQTLRTCYGYDANGRKISETKPSANLAVCP